MISDKNLKKMRDVQELNLPEDVHLQAWETADDGRGGKVQIALVTLRSTRGRLGELKGELEKAQASRLVADVVAVLTMPAETDMTGVEEIQVSGKQWKPHWTNADKTHLTALRVIVTEKK